MFNDNWFLFILILLLVFGESGINGTEYAILVAVVGVLSVCNANPCCCNHDPCAGQGVGNQTII